MSKKDKNLLDEISSKKKALLVMRIKSSSGNLESAKEIKKTRKEVARLFTKLNAK